MKIERTGSVRPSTPVKRTGKTGKSGDAKFSEALDQVGGRVGGVSGAAPAQAVDALLAIQEVDDAVDGRSRKGQRWGESILDKLEELRIGLIGGVIPPNDLEAITQMLREGRGEVEDPELNQVLDEIELRARVEIAKFRR
ncbi:MAG: flagellar assembly protein FliX [Rhodospirillaceae bacterium]|nr:flagellar assembly protein FliX [Rhodospirillaceae bacterium]